MTQDNEADVLRRALRDERLGNYLADKLRAGEARMDKLDHSVEELKSDMMQIKEDMSSALELLQTIKSAVKYIGALGSFIKWVGGIALGFAAIHALWEKFFK